MKYLFGQVWLWMLLSFLLGSLVTWLVLKLFRKPKVDVTEERISAPVDKKPEAPVASSTTTGWERDTDHGEPRVRDSALNSLDEKERTTALRDGADTDRSGSLSGTLDDAAPAERGPIRPLAGSDDNDVERTQIIDTASARSDADAGRVREGAVAAADGTGKAVPIGMTADDGPYGSGSARPGPGGAAPSAEWTVKGNADSMLFHTKESPFYPVTTAEVWFRTEEDAERAGFRPWNRVGGMESSSSRSVPPYAADVPSQPVSASTESVDYGTNAVPQQATSPDAPFGPGSAVPRKDGSAPSDEYTVKGNADSMLFHTTDSPYYPRTIAEVWFKTPADAERAGFTAWNRRRGDKPSTPLVN
ncbi:MAG: hypothetical protein M3548_20905 [Actinomycetota bacterium]|nr:hypothetical protein [Actinomycetota bacterium]